MHVIIKLSIAFFLACLSITVRTHAQAPAATPAPRVVKVSVSITDPSGRAVDDVRKEDLKLTDDGYQEIITYFEKDNLAVVYGLVIDSSGSVQKQFPAVLAAAKEIIEANRAGDATFIINFISSDRMYMVNELTSDKGALIGGLNQIKIEMGQTALIDALYLAAQYCEKRQKAGDHRRKALLLFSDGEERSSYYSEEKLFELLSRIDLPVFTVALVGELDDRDGFVRKSPRRRATEFVERLARKTGGRAFLLKSSKELADTIASLASELRMGYVIGYQPTKKVEKAVRRVEVKLIPLPGNNKRRVVARQIVTERN